MPKLTLLDMTQNILSSMSGDQVNDIADTVESSQVAEIIKEVYYQIVAERDWPHLQIMTVLTGLGDTTNPTRMQLPERVTKIAFIKYDKREAVGDARKMVEITYKAPEEFLDLLDMRTSTDTNIKEVTNSEGIKFNVFTDRHPTYWTSFDDDYIYFDAYKSTLDTTLQGSKSAIFAIKEPAWTASNTFIPDLPTHMFPYFLAEAKSVAKLELKQAPSAKDEQKSRRGRSRLQKSSWRQDGQHRRVDYGRRSKR